MKKRCPDSHTDNGGDREREVGGLIKFLKAFPGYHGYIITRDYQTQIKADGYTIEVVPIWKWLLQDNN